MRFAKILVAVGLVLGAAACVTGPPAGTPLPDLAMARIVQFTVVHGAHHDAIEFTTTIVNLGETDFRLHATRPNTSSDWTVNEVVPDGHGGLAEYATTAGYVYGGDGHNHWHVRDLASY